MTACPVCDVAVGDSELFCEACGAELSPTVSANEPPPSEPPPEPSPSEVQSGQSAWKPSQALPMADDLTGAASTCPDCGGEVAGDGYCGTCGARSPKRRDHFSEQPAAWVAGVCDRGVRHGRNEDALALAAEAEPGSRAVLVVCDGVSSSVDSDLASLAAARVARDVLVSSRARGMGGDLSLIAAVTARLEAAADAASEAVIEVTRSAKDSAAVKVTAGGASTVTNPASCTFVAAVVEQDLLVVGSVGDSRAYWLPDVGTATVLTLDDSFAQIRIASGVPRAEAESGPHSHAIMRWLGEDAPEHKPATTTMTLAEPGWLLVCSDGLWNYCSEAEDLAALVRQTSSGSPAAAEPLALAGALVSWANSQGGQDNITVALARIQPG
jgi:serine/threonine protein phosphatase PrpC